MRKKPSESLPAPRDDDLLRLPLFDGLPLARIVVVDDAQRADEARHELIGRAAVGFDTESRPTFSRQQVSEGPHLVQFATEERAYLFPTSVAAGVEAVMALLARPGLLKVGFGLASDRQLIARRWQTEVVDLVDLDQRFRALGFRRSLGVRAAVALTMGRRFVKSKKISTSDWSRAQLDERQKLYAANDAYAALRVHLAFDPETLRAQGGARGVEATPDMRQAKGTPDAR
ncbi:MAG: 3'-5' exonuclease [Burkholderiaceae bacterium]